MFGMDVYTDTRLKGDQAYLLDYSSVGPDLDPESQKFIKAYEALMIKPPTATTWIGDIV